MYKRGIILSAILALFAGISEAEIINVPDDHETIQAGIDATEEGDTVLVQPGSYEENLNINDHFITLASLTLITGDPAYIDSTTIDGGGQLPVVHINEVGGNVNLIGFIVQNGRGNGGGIEVWSSNITIQDMIIRDNVGVRNQIVGSGGGIFFVDGETLIIRRSIIANNASVDYVGGIIGYGDQAQANITLEEVIIRDNVGVHVGAIWANGSLNMRDVAILGNEGEYPGIEPVRIHSEEDMIWENLTVAGQIGRRPFNNPCLRGSFEEDSRLILRNCLIYGNENNEVSVGGGTFGFSYSLIEGGRDAVIGQDVNWGEGNLDEDPLFTDPDNGDYSLNVESPCIDAGDPESDLDPDGTRADMGAFPFFQGGVIEGFVFDLQSEQPLEGATVITTAGASAVTNDQGFWLIENSLAVDFNLTASMRGYLDSTMIELEVQFDDTLSITFNLLHAELEPSIEGIITEMEIGTAEQIDFSIANPGNGVLEWSVETRFRGDAGVDPWELRRSYQLGEQLEDAGLYGVVFIDSLFYVSGAHDGSPTIYILDKDGGLIDTFAQPGDHRLGMRDLTFDSELIWGIVGDTTYGMTLESEVTNSFLAPGRTPSAITWDSDREILWIGGTTENIIGLDRDGNQVDGMVIRRDGLRMYGLAYFPDDPDDAPLYLFHREVVTNRQTLHKHSFETGEKTFVTYLDIEDGRPQGAYITDQFGDYSWTFISVTNDADRDRVDVWQLYANTSWALIDPSDGFVNPAAEQAMTLTIDAADLAPIEYPAELIFRHNGRGLEAVIPIDLTVTPLSVEDREDEFLPLEFAITAAYPNPFNATVRLSYAIPEVSIVSLKLYDITGSLVDRIADGLHQSGQHAVTWNASGLPSGLYFVRLEAGVSAQTVKLVLMK